MADKVIVTGGYGFLGQHLVKELLDRDKDREQPREIVVVDLFKGRKIIEELFDHPQVKFVTGVDISQSGSLNPYLDGVTTVFHLAAIMKYGRRNKNTLRKINQEGSKNVLDACQNAGVAKLIHVGSIGTIAYDKSGKTLSRETDKIDWTKEKSSHYAYSKKLGVDAVLENDTQLQVSVGHPGIMLGAGDLKSIPLYKAGRRFRLFASPSGGTNFIDVRDVARGFVAIEEKGKDHEEYLIVSHNITHKELFQQIASHAGRKISVLKLPAILGALIDPLVWLLEFVMPKKSLLSKEGTVKAFHKRYFSNEKAKKELGWQPKYALQETIDYAVAWGIKEGYMK